MIICLLNIASFNCIGSVALIDKYMFIFLNVNIWLNIVCRVQKVN
jgi:hypothetical protein